MAGTEPIKVDLRGDGVLWLINRVVFHPRGFALAINPDGSFSMLGDGSEVWTFQNDDDDQRFAAVESLLHRLRARMPDATPYRCRICCGHERPSWFAAPLTPCPNCGDTGTLV